MLRAGHTGSAAFTGRVLRSTAALLLVQALCVAQLGCGPAPANPKERMQAFAKALAPSPLSSPSSSFSAAARDREDWPRVKEQLEEVRKAVGAYRGEFVEVATVRDGMNTLDYVSSGTYTAQYDCGKVVFEATLQYLEGGWFIKQVRISTPQDTWLLPVF